MSSTVDNYNYVIYNEFEKPQYKEPPPPNLFGFKVFHNAAPQELKNPLLVSHPTKSNSSTGVLHEIPDSAAVQSDLADFAERLNSTASKNKAGGVGGNMNVYNKCVFFVNSYNSSDLQDAAARILGEMPSKLSDSGKRKRNEQTGSICLDRLDHNENGFSFNFGGNNFIVPPQYGDGSITELLSRIESSTNRVADLSQETIIVSDSDDEPVTACDKPEPEQELFFVENDDLKAILSPNVQPGVYRKISPRHKEKKAQKPNVFTDVREKSGRILSNRDFQALYSTDCDRAEQLDSFNSLEPEQFAFEEIDIDEGNDLDRKVQCKPKASAIPVDWKGDSLWHLAHEILKLPTGDNLCFNRERNELIYRNPSTKKKVIYRIVQPEEMNLTASAIKPIIQLGNPEFIQCFNDYQNTPTTSTHLHAIPKKTTRGRPRKSVRKRTIQTDEQKHLKPLLPKTTTLRTRCGRVSKPPQHMQNNFKIFDSPTAPIYESTKDCDYKYNKPITPILPAANETVDEPKSKRVRNLPADYRCNVCNKIYLGKTKMARHLEAFPDHFIKPGGVQQSISEMSLYEFLVMKVQQQTNLTEDQRISLLLNDLTDFVDQMQSRSSHLITNSSAIYFVNSRVSKLLGTPEGHFGIDLNALNLSEAQLQRELNTMPVFSAPPPPRLDYNLSISLDDTIGDAKLHLSENMIASDDSLLRTVDDLVKEGIKNLTDDDGISRPEPSSVIHYDHASDNAVEAVNMKETTQPPPILDLSLDLFQFNSN